MADLTEKQKRAVQERVRRELKLFLAGLDHNEWERFALDFAISEIWKARVAKFGSLTPLAPVIAGKAAAVPSELYPVFQKLREQLADPKHLELIEELFDIKSDELDLVKILDPSAPDVDP